MTEKHENENTSLIIQKAAGTITSDGIYNENVNQLQPLKSNPSRAINTVCNNYLLDMKIVDPKVGEPSIQLKIQDDGRRLQKPTSDVTVVEMNNLTRTEHESSPISGNTSDIRPGVAVAQGHKNGNEMANANKYFGEVSSLRVQQKVILPVITFKVVSCNYVVLSSYGDIIMKKV